MDETIIALERAAAALWVAPAEEHLGSWLLRAAEGFTGRANSALPLGDPGLPLPDAVAAAEAWYRARGLTPMFAVPAPLDGDGGPLEAYLAARGWTIRSGATFVLTADAGGTPADARVRIDPEPDAAWIALYHYRGSPLPPVGRVLLMSAPWQGFGSIHDDEGAVIAVGRVAVAGEWASLTAIEVDPAWRRRGLGGAITAALRHAAAARGARQVLLQVEADNTAALALYQRLGFTPAHQYHYRVAPQS
jgi:ribosomal protein S18 acetylase RimI-like enzyme